MKWLAGLLLVVNLGLFAAVMGWLPLQPSSPMVLPADVGDLQVVQSPEPSPSTQQEAIPPQPDDSVVTALQPETVPENEPASAPSAATAAAPEMLASETAQPEAVKPATPAEPPCYKLGAFESREQAAEMAGVLAGMGVAASINQQYDAITTGFWVMLPPEGGRKAAEKRLARLQKAGISDVRRFVTGEHRNGISLGLFSSRQNAEKRAAQIEQKGFLPVVKPKSVEQSRYWLKYRLDPDEKQIDLKVIQKLFTAAQVIECG